jgi:hypothetical protein
MNATAVETLNPLFEILLWAFDQTKELDVAKVTDYVLNAVGLAVAAHASKLQGIVA